MDVHFLIDFQVTGSQPPSRKNQGVIICPASQLCQGVDLKHDIIKKAFSCEEDENSSSRKHSSLQTINTVTEPVCGSSPVASCDVMDNPGRHEGRSPRASGANRVLEEREMREDVCDEKRKSSEDISGAELPLGSRQEETRDSGKGEVAWGAAGGVKGNTGQARGRRLSLAKRLDLFTHNWKFYSPSFFSLPPPPPIRFVTRCRFLTAARAEPGWMKCSLLNPKKAFKGAIVQRGSSGLLVSGQHGNTTNMAGTNQGPG
ncbi:unnamed protein product [Pleuronectes platessa]|uniref:Uncharacterized protein n=1 Tax=Pleuronectes platessa TaxID=8262 RepID=A0A9N7UC32_PLEPL|nr:unnamed protein product [Pleuronectes platessa]